MRILAFKALRQRAMFPDIFVEKIGFLEFIGRLENFGLHKSRVHGR